MVKYCAYFLAKLAAIGGGLWVLWLALASVWPRPDPIFMHNHAVKLNPFGTHLGFTAAMMGLCNPLANRKAKSRPSAVVARSGSHLVRTKKSLKNTRLKIGGDAWAGIGNGQRVLRFPIATRNKD